MPLKHDRSRPARTLRCFIGAVIGDYIDSAYTSLARLIGQGPHSGFNEKRLIMCGDKEYQAGERSFAGARGIFGPPDDEADGKTVCIRDERESPDDGNRQKDGPKQYHAALTLAAQTRRRIPGAAP
jgi:hypothetical protein